MINRIVFHLFFAVFRILARLFPSKPRQFPPDAFRTILVFSAAGIGDTLTDSVAVRALKESFPKARLIVVTHRRRAALARHNPFADEVVLYYKSLARFLVLTRQLRERRPEAIVMLRGNDPDLWPLAWLVNRHAVVSCPVMTRFHFLISHPVSIPDWDRLHGVEQTLQIVRAIGAEPKDRRLVYEVQPHERAQIRDKLLHACAAQKPLVVFQLGGGRRSAWRDWPAMHFVELGRMLLGEFDIQLLLLGGPDLLSKAVQVEAGLPGQAINFTGRLTLVEAAALLNEAKILVSTDTGIMHLGFAVGVDTVALIHCNNPASRVGPHGYGDKHVVVQLEPPPGVPASKDVEMDRLSPGEVWPRLRSLCERHRVPRKDARGKS